MDRNGGWASGWKWGEGIATVDGIVMILECDTQKWSHKNDRTKMVDYFSQPLFCCFVFSPKLWLYFNSTRHPYPFPYCTHIQTMLRVERYRFVWGEDELIDWLMLLIMLLLKVSIIHRPCLDRINTSHTIVMLLLQMGNTFGGQSYRGWKGEGMMKRWQASKQAQSIHPCYSHIHCDCGPKSLYIVISPQNPNDPCNPVIMMTSPILDVPL